MEFTSAYQSLHSLVGDQVDLAWFVERIESHNHLESNKSISYDLMVQNQIPIPRSKKFSNDQELSQLRNQTMPFVVKFDTPITLGIQTTIVNTPADLAVVAEASNRFNVHSGIVQEFVQGYEFTVTVLVGQHNWVSIGTAKDYKKQFDNDQGANTFGMGSISPAPSVHSDADQIVDNIVKILRKQEDYLGFLSCQFIANDSGIWLLEYNTRFCDPEFQSMIELLDLSLIESLKQCQSRQYITQPNIAQNKNAVTISIVHKDWPKWIAPVKMSMDSTQFRIWRNHHPNNVWWGTVTNSGVTSYQDLAKELYQWLDSQSIEPFRYRFDIGQATPQTS